MLALEKVEEIRDLVALGALSQREIARQTGVSRATVQNVIKGETLGRGDDRDEDLIDFACSEVPKRCSGCGAMVYMPCVLCAVQSSQGSPNCNVEIPDANELLEMVEMTTEATGVADAWSDVMLEERWTTVD